MHSGRFTPILIIGFNRPQTIAILLAEVEKLDPREIWISIDGPRLQIDVTNVQETLTIVQGWALQSKHTITIIEQETNLGIYLHCMKALVDFYKIYDVGIVLEDDIEFHPQLIRFVDENQAELRSGRIWSICGHNPASDLIDSPTGLDVKLNPTHVHTIWGWAAHRNAILQFVELTRELTLSEANVIINQAAKRITSDPFVRLGLRKVWEHKIARALDSNSGGGWDNYWLLAGWNSGLPSLMPSYSLSRENPLQNEGQTHAHISTGKPWGMPSLQTEVDLEIRLDTRIMDIPKLKVWGITRRYCWLYLPRILCWKPNVNS